MMEQWEQYLKDNSSIEVEFLDKVDVFSVSFFSDLIKKCIDENRSSKLQFDLRDCNGKTRKFKVDGPCCNCCDAAVYELEPEGGIKVIVESREPKKILEELWSLLNSGKQT